MNKLSSKMVERAIDAIINVTDRMPNGNQELSRALQALRNIERDIMEKEGYR